LAENILRECLMEMKLDYYEASGEAAFYGPKIDIQMKFFNENKLHEESVSSIQIDFLSGERFGLSFLNENQEKICPWIIHRAPLGSHERFIAMLLEYYDGLLPFWLSPIQFYLFPVGDHALKFSESLKLKLRENGIRVEVDIRQVSLSKRLALGRKLRPYSFAIIGERELDLKKIEIQFRDSLKQVEIEKMSEFFRSL
jgi:threonyl-tRNA synthetase